MTAPCHESLLARLDATDLDRVSNAWDDLLLRSYDNRIFLTPLWFRTWIAHAHGISAHIFAERDGSSNLLGILPLQTVESEDKNTLSLLGDPNVADYMDGAADRSCADAILLSLWRAALEQLNWDRIDLRHVPSASPLIAALQRACGERRLEPLVEEDEVCPVAILCNTWEGYLQMLSKKQRHEIRRKVRRCEEGAEIVWRTTSDSDRLDADLDVFFRLHEASARDKAGFMTGAMRTLFRSLSRELLDVDVLRLSILERNGRPIAATIGFLHRDRYLLYNSGYDPTESVGSPGIVAVAYAMRDAIAQKAVLFDFLSGSEPYKYQVGAQNTYTCRIRVAR